MLKAVRRQRGRNMAQNPLNVKLEYNLRSRTMYTLSPFSKSARAGMKKIQCPALQRKSFLRKSLSKVVEPVGEKGRLDEDYNKDSNLHYIDQMFYEGRVLGNGSFGKVQAFKSRRDGKIYAIKIVNRFNKQHMNQEVLNLDIVSHVKNCCHYINAWKELDLLYIQFKVEAVSLAEYSQKNFQITEAECWDLLYDILTALKVLHSMNLCHNDIKPDNIMITYEGYYQLIDFGLMNTMGDTGKSFLSEGDGRYIANDIFTSELNPSGDIFSLGISTLEIAFDLDLPESGPQWHELRNCTWRTAPENIRSISPELETCLNSMMHRNPKQRPTAATILASFKMFQQRARPSKLRFNYYEAWQNKYAMDEPPTPVVHCILDRNLESPTLQLDIRQQQPEPVTPPRRVSIVVIHTSF